MVEGIKLITDIVKYSPGSIEFIVMQADLNDVSISGDFDVYKTDVSKFKSISGMVQPQGILAVCQIPEDFFSSHWNEKGFALYSDGIQDPGNLGTIFRAAEWYGVESVLIGPGTVDPFSSKVVQATMGSHSYLKIYQYNHHQLSYMSCPVVIADMAGENAYEYSWPEDGVLVLGNEGQGITSYLREIARDRISLPSSAGIRTESLNVSMACTSLLTLRHCYMLNING